MGEITQETLMVPGIDCAGCATRVKGALNQVAGVSAARVSVKKQAVTLRYDADVVTLRQLEERLAAAGYPVARERHGKPLPIHALARQTRGSARVTNVPIVSRGEYARLVRRQLASRE